MFFYIKITSDSGKEIVIDANNGSPQGDKIENLKIWIDTVDDKAKNRASNILNRVELVLTLDTQTKEICKDLMTWSLSSSGSDVYRRVQIDIRDDSGVVRSFDLNKMFVEDYDEKYEKECYDQHIRF